MPRLTSLAVALVMVSVSLGGCGEAGPSAGTSAPAASTPAKAAASPSGSASASAVASSSAAPAPSASPSSASSATITDNFAGGYDAKKKKMKLQAGASEPFWGLDKGKVAVGKGEVKLSVWSDGRVTGTLTGPLGDLTVEGYSEERALTGTLTPKEPGGFRGTIAGKIEGNKFVGRIEASSRDVTLVRESAVTLDKS